jgi:hypothetical protein
MPLTVVRKWDKPTGVSVYIGRPSPLGNPYVLYTDGDRDHVIELYREWLHTSYFNNPIVRSEIDRLVTLCKDGANIELQCYCAPKKCHGDVIKEFVETILST